MGLSGPERSIAPPQEDRHRCAGSEDEIFPVKNKEAPIRDRQVVNPVAIEVGHRDRPRTSSHRIVWARLKRSITISEQDGNGAQMVRIKTHICHGQVLNPVAIEVAHCNGRRIDPGHEVPHRLKSPTPLPNSTPTPKEPATARSHTPSPLKSPTAMQIGLSPTAKFRGAWKVPSPLPKSTETSLEDSLATAKSCSPSPLKSPTATNRGFLPASKSQPAMNEIS